MKGPRSGPEDSESESLEEERGLKRGRFSRGCESVGIGVATRLAVGLRSGWPRPSRKLSKRGSLSRACRMAIRGSEGRSRHVSREVNVETLQTRRQ